LPGTLAIGSLHSRGARRHLNLPHVLTPRTWRFVGVVFIDLTCYKIRQMSPSTLPQIERLVLELLLDGPDFGLNLVAKSDGRLKRGTVYVTLGRMERKGFITSEQEPQTPGAIGLPRRIYRATPLGERALRAWATFLRTLASEYGA
jgi:PadR family transcriptional regulator, regulatory protein PadR